MAGLRWCLRHGTWAPGEEEWVTALRSVQQEEATRIGAKTFRMDAKSSLVGRLMLRSAVHQQLDIPWADIRFTRTSAGKPYLTNESGEKLSLNVSHHGDYTVLAASHTCQVGVDVAKIEWPKNKQPVESLFGLMKNQFTDKEWQTIYQHADEWDQLRMFYRLWSLKESYVKATGVGLNMDPKRLEFQIESELERGAFTYDTKLYINGQLQEYWRFEETMLDSLHSVATAIHLQDEKTMNGFPESNKKGRFNKISMSKLLDFARPLGHSIPIDAYSKFQKSKDNLGQL